MKQVLIALMMLVISFGAKSQEANRTQSESDTRIAEYVTGATSKKGDVKALIVSDKITAEKILESDYSKEFAAISQTVDFVIAPNESVREALAKKISLEIVVPEKSYQEATQSKHNISWMVVGANGSKLGRVLASGFLANIIEPLSESDKPQE